MRVWALLTLIELQWWCVLCLLHSRGLSSATYRPNVGYNEAIFLYNGFIDTVSYFFNSVLYLNYVGLKKVWLDLMVRWGALSYCKIFRATQLALASVHLKRAPRQ